MKEPLIPGGYILLSRKVIESEIFGKPPLYMKVWVYLLSRAQHSDYKKLKRGQLFISIPEIIEAVQWKVGYRTVKPTKDQIFQILNWLRKGNESNDESNTNPIMITTTKATHGLLINIENYGFYQDPRNYESNGEHNNENATNTTREQRQSDNINKNVKNVKNDNKKDTSPKRVYDEQNEYYIIADFYVKEIRKNFEEFKTPNMQKWSDDIRKLIEINGKDKKRVCEIIRAVQQDSFWFKNCLSPSKLREKFSELEIKFLATGPKEEPKKGRYQKPEAAIKYKALDLEDM